MSIVIYDFKGAKQTGSLSLPATKGVNEQAVSQVAHSMLANADRQRAASKTRGLVSGGGKKPWRQKGTGRARAGSNRSPVWRGGGITFGPDGRKRACKQAPAKLRQSALQTALQQRASDGKLIVLKGTASLTKTKQANQLFSKIGLPGSTLLVATSEELPGVLGCQNLASVELTTATDFNLVDVVRHTNTVLTSAAWDALFSKAKAAKPAAKPVAKKPAAKKEAK